jgi:hypothetical protein
MSFLAMGLRSSINIIAMWHAMDIITRWKWHMYAMLYIKNHNNNMLHIVIIFVNIHQRYGGNIPIFRSLKHNRIEKNNNIDTSYIFKIDVLFYWWTHLNLPKP